MVFFLTSSGFMRELMARIVRNAIGRVVCVIADYSAAVLREAKRVHAMVIADRPSKRFEQALREARSSGEISGLIVVDTAGDATPPFAGAPDRPRKVILANGDHSAKEAVAFDLHASGRDFARIGEWLGVDIETAKTFVRRAELKNRRHPAAIDIVQRLTAGE